MNFKKQLRLQPQDQKRNENNTKSIKTASLAQARRPIYKSAVKSSDHYKEYLDELIQNIKF